MKMMNREWDLQSVIERASYLEERVNEEINKKKICCSENANGWFCECGETPFLLFEERQRLIASRDSLKQVEDILIHLQKMRAWHFINRQIALNQVEESRIVLMEKVSNYEGKPLSVINELNSSFGDGRSDFDWTLKKRKTNSFLFCCMKFLCNQDTWQRAIGGAAKLIAVSIAAVYFCRRRQQCCRSSSESLRIIPIDHIDVFKGRG